MAVEKSNLLSTAERTALLDTLKQRFEQFMHRHASLAWTDIKAKLEASEAKLWALHEMERTGGEPDVIGYDQTTGAYIFCDCAAESPAGRRSISYDRAGQMSRKENQPSNNAVDMAKAMGIELLDEAQYRSLQQLGPVDTKTSSWIKTPADIRALGGAIFGDFRYGKVFIYHNGAQSYYAARAFRGMLLVCITLLLVLGIHQPIAAQDRFAMRSPDGQLELSVLNGAQLKYSVQRNGSQVIAPSALGFTLNKPQIALQSFSVTSIDTQTVRNVWKPLFGEKETILNHYRECVLHLETKDAKPIRLQVVFRVFNDGIGFRYSFPEQEGFKHFIVGDELTEFALPGDHTAFWIPGDYDTNEYLYQKTLLSEVDALRVSDAEKDIALKTPIGKTFVQTPLLLQRKGVHIHIHEAALLNYPVMQLALDPVTFTLKAHLVPDAVGNKAYLETGFQTPWRTLIIGDTPEVILASDLILNLNEPSRLADVSWIKPQKFIGVWWEMHIGKGTWAMEGGKHAANTENVKRYIDFAAAFGIDGVLVEGWNKGWEDWFGNWKEEVFDFVTPYPDYDIAQLTAYARSKNVKLIMHHETSGSVTNYERRMEDAFDFMNTHGIETVKTGYVGRIIPRGEYHDGQWMNNHYLRVAQKAAEHKIMVVSHESSRPTGLHRTYPNWMASEAARGNEFNNAPTLGLVPEHETILAFTRLKGGPMDYTPGFFQFNLNTYDATRTTRIRTTLAKQLAMYVVFYSPIQMLGDLPENLQKFPSLVEFIVGIPMDWKESRILSAQPGDHVVYARKAKAGDTWYVAGISDEQARDIQVNFNFLDPGKTYTYEWVCDAKDADYETAPLLFAEIQGTVDAKTVQKIHMAKGGGFIMKITASGGR